MGHPAEVATPDAIRDTIDRLLAAINAVGRGRGWTRPSYSPEESAAHRVVAEEARRLGLEVRTDAAGNLLARLCGRDPGARALHVGSHLDTVSEGGAFDGQAGVAGAMALVASFVERGEVPPFDIVVTVIRAEESVWFPASYIGSRGFLGRLGPADLALRRADSGATLADHMRAEGFDPDAAMHIAPPPQARFVEIHIEQGPVLDAAQEPLAIVHGIRGGLRYRAAQIHGIWAHSGAAPRDGRADAVFAFSDVVQAMDDAWAQKLAAGRDVVVTFGKVDAAGPNHAMAKVPGHLGFCIDIRSDDAAVLDGMDAILKRRIAAVEAARPGIRFDLGVQTRSRPAALSRDLADRIAAIGSPAPRRMLSGAGHDAAAFAAEGWDTAMIFVRNRNGSHNPDEAMDPDDLARAVHLLRRAITCGAL